MRWVDEFCNDLRAHRATILEQEGRFFFDGLKREISQALPTIATRLAVSLKDLRFVQEQDSFVLTNRSHYPVVSVKAQYMMKRVLLQIKSKQANVRVAAEETQRFIDFCVKSDDQLYLRCEGQTVVGVEEAAKLVLAPLFAD